MFPGFRNSRVRIQYLLKGCLFFFIVAGFTFSYLLHHELHFVKPGEKRIHNIRINGKGFLPDPHQYIFHCMTQVGKLFEIDKTGPALNTVNRTKRMIDKVIIRAGAFFLHCQERRLKACKIIFYLCNEFR